MSSLWGDEEKRKVGMSLQDVAREFPRRRRATAVLATLVVVFVVEVWGLPLPVLLSALAPALLFAALVQRLAGRSRESFPIVAAAFVAGAVIAGIPASHLNQWLADRLSRWNAPVGAWAGAALVAPMVEEVAKGAVVLVASWLLCVPRDARAAAARGAQVGLGFSVIENTQYLVFAVMQGGWGRLPLAIYLRGVLGGAHHALFAATTALGLALWASAPQGRTWRVPALALLWAIVQHIGWNTLAAPLVTQQLCGAGISAFACRAVPQPMALVVTVPLIVLAALTPGALTIVRIIGRSPERAGSL